MSETPHTPFGTPIDQETFNAATNKQRDELDVQAKYQEMQGEVPQGSNKRIITAGLAAATTAIGLLAFSGIGRSNNDYEPTQPGGNAPNVAPAVPGGTLAKKKHLKHHESAPKAEVDRRYPMHTNIEATIFGIGEKPSKDNDYISNEDLAWDGGIDPETGKPIAVALFGGVDDAKHRNPDGLPIGFKPLHNPYYFALPVDEFNNTGLIPGAREASPWAHEKIGDELSLFKGRWIEVSRDGKSIYAQWKDTGPHGQEQKEADDYKYVFGDTDARPKNKFGLKAGLDLSPTAAHDLGFSYEEGGAKVSWHFVDEKDVPDGPWKDYHPITNIPHWE